MTDDRKRVEELTLTEPVGVDSHAIDPRTTQPAINRNANRYHRAAQNR